MNLVIKAERICDGCMATGVVNLVVNKIESALMFVECRMGELPNQWVQPMEWEDKRLRKSFKIDNTHIFCSKDCMYKHYDV